MKLTIKFRRTPMTNNLGEAQKNSHSDTIQTEITDGVIQDEGEESVVNMCRIADRVKNLQSGESFEFATESNGYFCERKYIAH